MFRRCVVTLLKKSVRKSASGFQTRNTEIGRDVIAEIGGATQSEFYKAASAGMKPTATFRIPAADYAGERLLTCEGKRYRIIRTFPPSARKIELTCEGDAPNED